VRVEGGGGDVEGAGRNRRARRAGGAGERVSAGIARANVGFVVAVAGFFALIAGMTRLARADEPPEIPIGLDAYHQWDKWPQQRIGARAYMRSTYDRRGGNEGADASHFLYQLADDRNVTLDVEGGGVLYFARYNHWHGSPWRYVIDGAETVVA